MKIANLFEANEIELLILWLAGQVPEVVKEEEITVIEAFYIVEKSLISK